MGTASQQMAEFVAGLRFDDLPPDVVAAARRHMLDAVGVALAASALGAGGPVIEMTRSWAGARESSVIGYDFGAPAPWAALANGTLTHALDYDDTHVESVVHPSAFVVPAAIAVGEEIGASGRDIVTAAVAGYEVATRIGAAAPGRFHVRGQHTTGLCGTFGAAAVAGRLWGLTSDEIAQAFGIAGSQSSGLFAYLSDGSETKRLHAGWAAHGGIVAADLARRGFTGPSTIFEGPHGLFDAFLAGEEPDRARLVRGLGTEWETTRIAIKPYPACHFVHAFMDAGIEAGVKWADIDEIVCSIAPPAIGIVAEPRAPRLHPATTYQAQFSLPFAVASAIVGGRDALEYFGDDARADRRVLTLAERVHHEPDTTLPFPKTYGGKLRVYTRGGRSIEIEELVNRGHPDRPLSDEELASKFLKNARMRLETRAARRALTKLQRIDQIDKIENLTSALQTP
ncbi:MAG: MmgE/PrpD family protein [Actinobacteria bacterium]|nr:MAG: MmgE/PrpD family protein [Actinomycetota bacterium]